MGPETVRRSRLPEKSYCGCDGEGVFCLLWGEPGRTPLGSGRVRSEMGSGTVRRSRLLEKAYCGWDGEGVFCLLWGEPGGTPFGVSGRA